MCINNINIFIIKNVVNFVFKIYKQTKGLQYIIGVFLWTKYLMW